MFTECFWILWRKALDKAMVLLFFISDSLTWDLPWCWTEHSAYSYKAPGLWKDSILLPKQQKEKKLVFIIFNPLMIHAVIKSFIFKFWGTKHSNLTASLNSVLWKWSWEGGQNIIDLFQKLSIYMNRKYTPPWSLISNYLEPGNWMHYFMLFNLGFRNLDKEWFFLWKNMKISHFPFLLRF